MIRTALLPAGVTSLLFSCKKENAAENYADTSNVTYQLVTTNSRSGEGGGEIGRTTAVFLTWTGGTASVSEIKFEAKGDNKVEYKSKSVQTIDLANALNTLGGVGVPYGTYSKIEFKVRFVPTSTAPLPKLLATYEQTNGGAAIPVIVRFNEAFEPMFEKKRQQPSTQAPTTPNLEHLPLVFLIKTFPKLGWSVQPRPTV